MPRRNHRSRAAHRGPKNQVWTSVINVEQALAAGVQQDANIVQSSDWTAVDGEKATLLTVRGYITISGVNDATIIHPEGSVQLYIAKIGAAFTPAPAVNLAATYVQQDILWTGGFQWNGTAIGVADGVYHQEINIKVKRKITVADTIRLVIGNNRSETVDITYVLRGLVLKSG